MSLYLLAAAAVFLLDAWALDRLWRKGAPRSGRLRWTAAVVFLPGLGALLCLRRPAAAAPDGGQ